MAAPTTVSEFHVQASLAVQTLLGADTMHVRSVEALDETADELGSYEATARILLLHPVKVTRWIERLIAGPVADRAEVEAVLGALATTFHEMAHAAGPGDRGEWAGRSLIVRSRLKGPADYEEAIAELAARMSLTAFVEFLEFTDRLPVPIVYESDIYVAKMAAIAPVIEKFVEEAGISVLDGVRLLAAELPDTRATAVATLLADRRGHRELPGRARFIARVEEAFRQIQLVNDITAEDYPGRAREELRAAIVRGDSEAR